MTEKIFFKPHIGKGYDSSDGIFGRKVLIVGDSHYCGDYRDCDCGDSNKHPECVNFTSGVVSDYLNPSIKGKWKKTFSTFINSFYDRSTSIDERKIFMDSIAFYNYLQVSAGSGPYETTNFNYSEERHGLAYMKILSSLTPDYVIVWGGKVKTQIESLKISNSEPRLSLEDGQLIYLFVKHPSQGYGRKYHHELFERNGLSLS